MTEAGERTMWSFPQGSVAHDQSVKDYAVECTFERGMLGGGFVWPYTDV